VNLLIGPNNAGKSNLFRFLQASSQKNLDLKINDRWKCGNDPIRVTASVSAELALGPFREYRVDPGGRVHLQLEFPGTSQHLVWSSRDKKLVPLYESEVESRKRLGKRGYEGLSAKHRGQRLVFDDSSGTYVFAKTDNKDEGPQHALQRSLANLQYVGALRSTSPGKSPSSGVIDGSKVLPDLLELRNKTDRGEWNRVHIRIKRWLSSLLGKRVDAVELRDAKQVSLHMNDLLLDLSDLGAGVTELVILLFRLCLAEDTPRVLLLEELEAHLHPSAVIRFLKILEEEFPRTQMFLASHSTALVDAAEDDWRIFRVGQEETGATRVEAVFPQGEATARLDLLRDLGVRPSQLFFPNCLLLVEGPSDAIYLQSLIQGCELRLLPDRDFGFLVYGGSSLKHYGFADLETAPGDSDGEASASPIVQILSLCTRPAIVYDQDGTEGKPYAKRLVEAAEFLNRRGRSNVALLPTPGREAENLVRPEVLLPHLREAAPDLQIPKQGKRYDIEFQEEHWDCTDWSDPRATPVMRRVAAAYRAREGKQVDTAKIVRALNGAKVSIARSVVGEESPFTDAAVTWCRDKILPFLLCR